MKKWTLLAILLTLISFGAIQETLRIFTSQDADIVNSRTEMIPISLVLTGLILFGTVMCWRKAGVRLW